MAIEERVIKAKHPGAKDQWEIKATGKDVHALRGMMRDAADECNARNEKANKEMGLIEIENALGKRDVVREDQARRLQRKGYAPTRKSFIVPDLPWLKKKRSRKHDSGQDEAS